MLDVRGTALDADDRRRLADPVTGGVILFARNFSSRAQLTALCAAIRAVRPGLLIAVDQEGGRVQRFRQDGFTRLPPPRVLGRLAERDLPRALRHATTSAYVLAAELRAADIDLSFTPVLDLDLGRASVIGDRALHHDARRVADLARAVMLGLAMAGMANCGKHFPGHGAVLADTHAEAATDPRDQAALMADAAVYPMLGTALRAVMAAHVVYPALDSLPAGFSPRWLKGVLREQLGFDGAVFSDDLSMEGARVAGDVVAGARLALQAGCDMVLVCNDGAAADRTLDGLRDLLPGETAQAAGQCWSADSSRRLAGLMPGAAGLGFEALQDDALYQEGRRAIAELSAMTEQA